MNCSTARDRLVDHALGTGPADESRLLEQHIAWCAACRKEARELQRAASTFAFALAPVQPPAELEDRIVDAVGRLATHRREQAPRRGRLAVAAAVAALLAVSALGWGAAMAGRAARFEDAAKEASQARQEALVKLADALDASEFRSPDSRVFVASLAGSRNLAAGGAALTLVSPEQRDSVIVSVGGLRADDGSLPYTVWLVSEDARIAPLPVGKITAVDANGSADVSKRFAVSLIRYSSVQIRDARDAIVLSGPLVLNSSIPSPTP